MSTPKKRKCSLCDRHNNYAETLKYCDYEGCENWIHSKCKKKRYNNIESKWLCNIHKRYSNTSVNKSSSNDTFVSQTNDEFEIMSEQEKCTKCDIEITDVNFKVCHLCNTNKHNNCLSENETKSYNETNDKIVCDNCLFELANKSFKKVIKKSNSHVLASSDSESSSSDSSSSDSELDSEDDSNNDARNVTKRKRETSQPQQNANDFFLKLSLKKLPVVTDDDLSWTVFYAAFKETYQSFSDNENVRRIQDAIKDEKVKRIGGKTLFNPKTYVACLKNINKRLKNNLKPLYKEASELENHVAIKSTQKVKIIEFIDKLRNFDTLAQAYNEKSYTNNQKFLANVANALPTFLKTAWERKQAKLERKHKKVTLSKLIDTLTKFIPTLELSIRNESFTQTHNRKDRDDKDKRRFDKPRVYHNTNNKSNEYKKKFFCWFHKNDSHPFNKCKDLWRMDGRAVTALAKQNGICTYCGSEWLTHKNCPNDKLKCNMEGCSFPHHSIFCYKRKANVEFNNKESHTSNFHHTKNRTKPKKDNNQSNLKKEEPNPPNDFEEEPVDEMETIAQQLNNAHFYTNNFQIPAHSSKDTRFNKPCVKNINLVDNSNIINTCNNTATTASNILSVVVVKLNKQKEVALLIDSGSTVSLLEETIANELEIKGPWLPLELRWSGNQKRYDNYSRVVKTSACGLNSNKFYSLYFRTVRDLKISPQKFIADEFYAKYQHILPLNLHNYENISGIIGIDNIFVFEQLKLYKPKTKDLSAPYGVRCPLGDYLFGSYFNLAKIYDQLNKDNKVIKNDNRFMTHSYELKESELKELDVMELEVMGLDYKQPYDNNDRKIAEEVYVLDLLENKTKKVPKSNHFKVPLLWSDIEISLNTYESFKLSLRRFLIVEKQAYKLGKFQECVAQIQNLLAKGYARELTEEEIKSTNNKTYYNPIFFIHPSNKRTRMIWDLAAKVKGKSLNDFLIAGPNMYNDLLEIIFQMRERTYLFKGDLSEMFHQIFVDDKDTDSLRFLFRLSPDDKVRVFKMLVLPFGAKCSPTISQYVKNLVALNFKHDLPSACDTILNNSYVDDIVKSVDSLDEAHQLPIQIKRILHTGGFNLLKINSNSQNVLNNIKSNLKESELSNQKVFSNEKHEKLLGYEIDFENDSLSISLNLDKFPSNIITGEERPNKRQVLQVLMTLFDPIGLVQFVTSKMKILYHKLCQEKYDWDQVLNDQHFILWQKCLEWFKLVSDIHIPRLYCTHYSNASEIQLWAFGDAGKDIACGALYLRFLNHKKEQLGYNLVHAKSFVTPIKQQRTIPELELNVAYKICIMANDVTKMHSVKINKNVFVTDNSAVKEWISNSPKKPTTYVKNRVDKIHNLSKKEDWFWVPTDYMVADYGTKITSIPEINYNNKWFHPRLFCMPEENWPEFTANSVEMEQQLNLHYLHTENAENENNDDEEDILEPSKFNKYLSLIDAYQNAFRFLHLAKNEKIKKKIDELKVQLLSDKHNRSIKTEIKSLTNEYYERKSHILNKNFKFKESENLCFAKAQKSVYSKEIKLLKGGKPFPINNKIHKLNPFLDHNDIIRVSTRIPLNSKNVEEYGYDMICPILLPKNHPLTTLIILKYHENNKHSLNNSVVMNLMQRFHIPHIKWIVNQTIKTKCLNCRIEAAKPEPPLMGDLPAVRLAHHKPSFTNAIVDLAGPISVNIYRNVTDKRYIFVYSCLTTRAIHLELIERMDADATLIALTNTINLRGAPKIIVSDNGLNFKGAKNVLQADENKWNKILLEKGVITSPITWKFGPPRSPHSQGSIERMVGLTKTILKKIIDMSEVHKKLLTDFMLRAILNEVIGILNNRPLTLIPIKGTNTDILTPNYFLIGRQTIQTLPANVNSKKTHYESYDDLKIISNILWNHWIKYYLPNILMREKWINIKDPLKEGDIVITVDTGVANSWRIGKILEVFIGSKNQAREYKVMLGKNDKLPDLKNLTRKELMKIYKNEKYSIVNRGALAVAKIDVDAIKI